MKKALGMLPVLVLSASLAQASTITFQTSLSGPAENPPNSSLGTGFATLLYDNVTHLLSINVSFQGLSGTTTASHIHCCVASPGTAGVATTTPTFTGFPLGVTAGTYSAVLDLTLASSYNPAFITSSGGIAQAEQLLMSQMVAGNTYLNIHTTVVPGGEIRGFLATVPEPATLTLFGVGLAGLAITHRRRRA